MTYKEYAGTFSLSFDTVSVDYCLTADGYSVFENSKPLSTPGGKPISDPSEDFIRSITTDMQLSSFRGKEELSSLVIFSYARDILEGSSDPFLENWSDISDKDPFVQMKSAGKAAARQLDPEDPLFSFAITTLSGLTRAVNRMAEKAISELALEEETSDPFNYLLLKLYGESDIFRKSAVQALNSLYPSGIVLPLMLVREDIAPEMYVKGLLALGLLPVEDYFRITQTVTTILSVIARPSSRHSGESAISDIINAGEGDQVEFKSTLRWDIRAGKTNPAIERASLKTIAAFLNTSGGTLLIGIRDDGSVEGIETDKFVNEDKFLLHLWTLIRNCLGRDLSPYIRTRIEKMDEKSICAVTCLPSARPAYLRQPGFDEELYIRVGPSSNALDISEAVRYIGDRFGTGRSVL